MTSNDRVRESQEREKRRQDWAARQDPELVTTQQALAMFGRSSYAGFADFMKLNDVIPVRSSGFFSSNFYIKSEVEKLVLRGAMSPKRGVGRPVGSVNSAGSRITFETMKDGHWTKEEFIVAWGSTADVDKAQALLDRAPSFMKLAPIEAYQLMLILLNLGGRDFRLIGGKVDRRTYDKYVGAISKDKKEYSDLIKIIHGLYRSTDIGALDPKVVVSILYELMTTNPNRPPA